MSGAAAVRVGLIGCGRIAQLFHLPILAALPDAALVALAEPDPRLSEQAGRRAPRARRFPDCRSLLADSEAEAVVICLPPALHAEAAVAAFEAGRHVYLEKPIATDPAGADAVVRAWRRADRVGMMGFNFRFNPAFAALGRRLAAGEIGEVVAARATFCSARRELPAWKRTRATGGGALRDLGAHHLDLVPHLLGAPVVRVAGRERSQVTEADTVLLHLELASGVPVEVTLSLSSGINANRLEFLGTDGALASGAADAAGNPVERAEGRHARLIRLHRALAGLHPKRLLRPPGFEPSFAAALTAFVGAVRAARDGGPPPALAGPDMEDGRRCLAVVAAAERAIASGRTEPVVVERPLGADRDGEHREPAALAEAAGP